MSEGKITRKGGGVNVNDATATENDVLQGETFYSGNKDIKTGNIPSKGAQTFTPGTSNQTISSGQYLSGTQTILGDANLVPDNIQPNVTIFGVTGTPLPNNLEFDGVDDYVSMGLLSGWNVSNYAVEVTFAATDPNTTGIFYGGARTGSSNIAYMRANYAEVGSSTQRIFQYFRDNSTVYERFNTTDAQPVLFNGQSNVLRMEYFSGNSAIIVNGVSQSLSYSFNQNPTNFVAWQYPVLLGAFGNNSGTQSSFIAMKLYDFKIYNGSTLFLHYDLSEGSGTTLFDKAGNNDGTIYGATWGQG